MLFSRLRITQLKYNTFSAQSADSWGKYMHVSVQFIVFETNTKSPLI